MTAPPLPSRPRAAADRCPGLLRPHLAADGAIVRLRLPGGVIPEAALRSLAAAASQFGDGSVQLTSRANLQLRGVRLDDDGQVPGGLIDRVTQAGLLPSVTHELVRNIACSPRTGRTGGLTDLRPILTELDTLICGTPSLVDLPGRFLFALDDGSDDITMLDSDLGLRAVSSDRVVLLAGGAPGPVVPTDRAARLLVALAETFLRLRGDQPARPWRVRELIGGGPRLLHEVFPEGFADQPFTRSERPPEQYGPVEQYDDRMLWSIAVPLGLLTPDQVDALGALAANGSGLVVVTPWRSVIVPDLPATLKVDQQLARVGLSGDAASRWRQISACTGAPGCASAAAPTRTVATYLAGQRELGTQLPIHVVACHRSCGSPTADHLEVLISEVAGSQQFSVSRPPVGPGAPGMCQVVTRVSAVVDAIAALGKSL